MIMLARVELRRFLLVQHNEFQRVGYPGLTPFAKNIAQGTLALPTPTEDDPVLDVVATWYHEQRHIDRLALARHFLPGGGSEYRQAKLLWISRKRLRERLESLIRRCARALTEAGKVSAGEAFEPARKLAFA